jgi:hypothetical protein
MRITCGFIIELYNEEKQEWLLVKWNDRNNEFEQVHIEKLDQIPGETNEDFEDRVDAHISTFPIYLIPRNYRLFALLANVCNNYDIIPNAELRGYPTNMSDDATVVSHGWNEETSTFYEIWELMDVLDTDIRRSGGVLYSQYIKNELREFEDIVERIDIYRKTLRARIIMNFG